SASGAVTPNDFIIGLTTDFNPLFARIALIKALVFAFIITSVSAYQGYYTSGGALEVGQASTRGVVMSCIIILCADYVIAQLML
ncbi:MAG: ABC transporter permease, partial [Sphingobacteriaceae bacterium]